MLQLFALQNLKLSLLVTAGTFLLFAIFYTLVYRLTTHGYYRIVSGEIAPARETGV